MAAVTALAPDTTPCSAHRAHLMRELEGLIVAALAPMTARPLMHPVCCAPTVLLYSWHSTHCHLRSLRHTCTLGRCPYFAAAPSFLRPVLAALLRLEQPDQVLDDLQIAQQCLLGRVAGRAASLVTPPSLSLPLVLALRQVADEVGEVDILQVSGYLADRLARVCSRLCVSSSRGFMTFMVIRLVRSMS